MKNVTALAFIAFLLISCSSGEPGDLKGKWKYDGIMPLFVEFRNGESETMSMIEKVTYKIDGNTYLVTSESGPAKGLTVRYEIIDPNTMKCQFGTFHRMD